MEALLMKHFCEKYGLGQYSLCRKIKEYDIIWVEGRAKPRIVENEKNIELARVHSLLPACRPRKPILEISEFCAKYAIDEETLKKRWKCLQKEERDGKIYISETRNNLKHCKLLT